MKHSLRWGVTLMSLIAWACGAEPLPMLEPAARSFSFAVLGDLHFSRPAFERQQTLRAIAASLKTVQPPLALVCHTGDLVSGEDANHRQWDAAGMAEEFAGALACVTNAFQVPFFMAVGNHDRHGGGTVYAQTILPFFSRSLSMPVSRPYFAFCYGNTCFVFLDYMEYKATARREPEYREQQAFLEETLAAVRANPGIRHVFAFGHYPLWAVATPGYENARFTSSVAPALAAHPADAYFCGHTHNTGAWVRKIGETSLTQIKGVAIDASDPLIPMEERRALLIPRAEMPYGWGYLSGPSDGHYLVNVDERRVRVQLRSGDKTVRAFEWQTPGHVVNTMVAEPPARRTVSSEDLAGAKAAALVFTAWRPAPSAALIYRPEQWAVQEVEAGIIVNGEPAGTARIKAAPYWAAFLRETRVPLPAEACKRLKAANDVTLTNPGGAVFGVGSVRLEVTLADGSALGSAVCDRFYFSAPRPDGQESAHAAYGWDLIPAALRDSVAAGEPLGPLPVRFLAGDQTLIRR